MAEKLGETFVLMALRDAAFRAALKSDEAFAMKSAAAIQAYLSKIRLSPVVMSIDTVHLKKSIDVAEAVVGVGMERMRKLARIPTYMDARPMRKSLRTVATDVNQAFDQMRRQSRLNPIFDARAMRSSMAQLQQAMGAMRAQQMSSMATMPAMQAALPRQVTQPSRFRRMMGGGDSGGMGAGGALLAGATGGLAATAGIRAFSMLEQKVKGLIRTGMDANATMERLGQSFEVMLGSAAAGKRVLESLRVFAEKTPFEMKDIAQVATMLLSTRQIAEDQLIPTIRKIGDAASGSSEGFAAFPRLTRAITQMMNKGKIQAEEMMQLSEAGVPAWQALAQAMGKTVPEVQKMSETGKLGLAEIMKLVDALGGQFDGLADKQSKTFEGLSSTWRDQLANAVMKVSKPLFELSKLGLQNLTEWMNTEQAQKLISILTEGMESVMGKVKEVGLSFVEAAKKFDLSTITSVINSTLQTATKVIAVLTAAFSNPLVVAVTKFLALSGVISGVIAVAATFGPSVLAALSPVSMTVVALTAGFVAVKKSIENALSSPGGEQLRSTVSEIVSRVGNLGGMLRDTIVPLLEAAGSKISKMFSSSTGVSFWERMADGVNDLIAGVETLAANWENTWNAVKLIGQATLLEWWDSINHLFTVQWPAIALGFWEGMGSYAQVWGNNFLEMITIIFGTAKELFASVFSTNNGAVEATANDIVDAMSLARERATRAAEAVKARGGTKEEASQSANAELIVGLDRAISALFDDAAEGVNSQAAILGRGLKDLVEQQAKAAQAITDNFREPIGRRLGEAGTVPENAQAKALREQASSLLEANARIAETSRRGRGAAADALDRKERDARGKAGVAEWLEKGKSAVAGAAESLKSAIKGPVTAAVPVNKKKSLEFTSSSDLWQTMAKALMPSAAAPMAKTETLLEKILTELRRDPKKTGETIGRAGKSVVDSIFGAGKTIGRGIIDPKWAAKEGVLGIAGGLDAGIKSIRSGSGWLSGMASGFGVMPPEVVEAIAKAAAEVSPAAEEDPAVEVKPKGEMRSFGGKSFGSSGGGVWAAEEERKGLLDRLNKALVINAGEARREEDPLMKLQNEILERGNAIQQQIVGAVHGLAGAFGFGQ